MKCTKCGINDRPYKVKTGSRKGKIQSYCKECNKEQVIKRQRKLKQQCVEYAGGECKICGYKVYLGALEFHHLDPSKKDIGFSKFGRTSWDKNKEKIIEELDKCVLLCANCHREVHGGLHKEMLVDR
jgi:5-methylcytosine-specific restriction endonuclease McrA